MTAKLTGAEQARFADAHNLFAEFGATWGIPGLLLLLAWLGAVIVQLWRAERQRSRSAPAPGSAAQAAASSGPAAGGSTAGKGGRGTKGAPTGAAGARGAKAIERWTRRQGGLEVSVSGLRPGTGGRAPKRGAPQAIGWAPLGLATLGAFLV